MKIKQCLVAGGALMVLATQTLLGVNGYVSLVPNGNTFSCSTCHVSGSTSRNAFGSAFANNGHVWNATLARADSDRDGYTNGEELGDPSGTWTTRDANPSGPVYNPGDSGSHPTITAGVPVITTQPSSQTVKAGATVAFTVVASGLSMSYQWQKDGVNISGATASSLTLPSVTTVDAGKYRVVVSNSSGSVTSASATLRVRARRK